MLLPVLSMTLFNGGYAIADDTIVITSMAATANGRSIANVTYKAAKAFTETYCLFFSVDVAGKP